MHSPEREAGPSCRTQKVIILSILFHIIIYTATCNGLIHFQTQQAQPIFNGAMQQSQLLQQQQQQSQLPNQQLLEQQMASQLLQQPNGQTDMGQDGPLPINSGINGNGPSARQTSLDRDGPVFRYQAIPLNSTTVKLMWSMSISHHADNFEIKYGPIPESTEVYSYTLNGTARDFIAHQLLPDTLYQFQLQAKHGDHAYKPLLATTRTPSANYVSKNMADYVNREITPLGVKAEAKSNTSIQLSWTEPDKPINLKNSIRVNIIRYYIDPSALAGNPLNDSSKPNTPQYHYLNVTNPRDSKLIVQRLKPATEYAFAVKTAYYSPDGKRMFTQSGFSMDTIAKTFDIEPSPPRNFTIRVVVQPSKEEQLIGQTPKLELTWAPPESPNGQIRGYAVLYAHDQNIVDEKWQRILVNDSNVNNWFVGSLRPGLSYYFKMRAINQRGFSGDSDIRLYSVPPAAPSDKMLNAPIPANNILLLAVIFLVFLLFILTLIVSRLCRTKPKSRKGSLNTQQSKIGNNSNNGAQGGSALKLNGYASTNSSSTVTARVGTLARNRRGLTETGQTSKPDFWISAMDQQQEVKSNISEKSNSDINTAMVSIQRDSPQFVTQTQLAPTVPEYRFATGSEQQVLHQLQQSHYHPGEFTGGLAFDQMDNATASALMTLSKRQQQQMQKYQIQFAATGVPPMASQQAPSPHQQPPPPPPLNIEQQHNQPVYGTRQPLGNTRSLRIHRPTLYDPVSGSFVQNANCEGQPPNYNSHIHPMMSLNNQMQFNNNSNATATSTSNTLQFHHPHQTSTLMSRRSTNTLRSFQSSGGVYGQIGSFAAPPASLQAGALNGNQPQQLLQSHQAVINQLNNSTYPSLPLKHVSAVRPQIMSSLEDQIEMELAEKEQQHHQQSLQSQDQQQPIKQ